MFKILICTALFLIFDTPPSANAGSSNRHLMWYNSPARVWDEALPIGNGRLGAMVFGNPATEQIQLNEHTFWSGGPSRNDNPNALAALPAIRQLIFDGKFNEAQDMVNRYVTAQQLHGSIFQPVGNLTLAFPGHQNFSDFRRELDLQRAVHTTTYKSGGVSYMREVFASAPDQVIVVRLTANRRGSITFTAGMNSQLSQSVRVLDENNLEMTGLSSTHEGVTGQVRYSARARIVNSGGTIQKTSENISVSNANEVLIFISIATNFIDYLTLSANEAERSLNYLQAASHRPFRQLLSRHISDHQEFFNRVSLDLGSSPYTNYPTDERIRNFAKRNDPELAALFFQFGRYLLISSSRPGGQPANLQGIWNSHVTPWWDSKYTININTQMNYWPSEKTNLAEMHEPLVQMIKELSQSCRQTAQTMYGARGWVAHHNTDLWRICGVIDGSYWGMWPMGGAWLTQHLWKRFLYNGDVKYLESVYPVMRSATEFFMDVLVEEPQNGWLVVSPSISPENNPSIHSASVAAGTTIDNQILFDLFSNTIKASEVLNKDAEFRNELKKIRNRLAPMQIGQHGQLQEWLHDWDNPNDPHRHISHLYGLFPSNQITPHTSVELMDATRTTLIQRGDESTGWSMGWKVNLWARLQNGNHAYRLLTYKFNMLDPLNPGDAGGVYPNMFGAHPPFQIDGNFGGTAGIAEMLLQTHDGAIHLLPALPDVWKTGEINGLRAYGGFEVSFSWKDGEIEKITIKSNLGGNARIRVPNEIIHRGRTALSIASGENPNPFFETPQIKPPIVSERANLNPFVSKKTYLYDIQTIPGETYVLMRKPS